MSAESGIPKGAPAGGAPRWWQWPTVLSLDAPAVALVWQAQLAQSVRVPLGRPGAVVLALSVWLAYAADRWIEGWRTNPARPATQRHGFYQRYRRPVAIAWTLALAVDIGVAWRGLSPREFGAGLALLGAVAAYLLSHQLIHRHIRWRLPKEVCVAALFGAGAALFPAAAPGAYLTALAGPLAMFTLLCLANCLVIARWEREVDRTRGEMSFVLQYAWGSGFGRTLPWLLAGTALVWAAVAPGGAGRAAAGCAGASAIMLGLVDCVEPKIGWPLARVLADVALLTPLVPLGADFIR